jgi:hypothetical protein
MTTVSVTSAAFTDIPGMPHAHTDERRIITEDITYQGEDGSQIATRITRIEVTGHEALLGNHFHTFDERFAGKGGGTLYVAPANNPADITCHVLDEDGWGLTVPANVIPRSSSAPARCSCRTPTSSSSHRTTSMSTRVTA